jgi:hypothetical protein
MLSACVNNTQKYSVGGEQLWKDSLKYVVVGLDSTHEISYLNPMPSSIDFNELKIVDSLLTIAVDSYNVKINIEYENARKKYKDVDIQKDDFLIELRKYVKQVVVYKNREEEKEVWINCYRSDEISNVIVDVNDGGNSFFNVKINLRTKLVYDFSVNGDA